MHLATILAYNLFDKICSEFKKKKKKKKTHTQ